MTKELPVGQLKRDFRRVLDAAEGGEQTVILRRGKPVAVVAPLAPDRSPSFPARSRHPGGLLSLVGCFEDWDSMAQDIAQIMAARQSLLDRPPPDLD